jgi:hypothetical protein
LNALPNTKVFIDEHTFFPAASRQLIAGIAPYITTFINKYGKLLFKHGAALEKNLDVPPSYIIIGCSDLSIRKPSALITKKRSSLSTNPYARTVGTYNSPNGKDKDRSLKEAYLKIIDNAETYIYIEDQYLVNLDVAHILNKKIKEPGFQRLIFAIQDSMSFEF